MAFNTAIFYDIENLLKGYHFTQNMIANLSLEEILDAVRQTNRLGQIALQRAYANWSDPRLAIMRQEINELGIDPIQVFGFSRDPKKNAADIQLAIDAVDVAHVRPALDVFVIVSGDGGFASLAKKLHEYGKTVIGCAYRNATNRTFQAVCDDFIWINDPDEEERQERPANTNHSGPPPEVTDPRNVRLCAKIRKLSAITPESVLAKTQEILAWYANDPMSRSDLMQTGIYLNVVQEAVKFAVPGFQAIRFGFPKFIEYMQYACKGSVLCVARPPNAQAVLTLRNALRAEVEILTDLDPRDLHTADGYRVLLATATPIFRLPEPEELRAVIHWLIQNPPEELDLGSILESLEQSLQDVVPSQSAKLAILSLVSAEAFERTPQGLSLAEQRLTLFHQLRSGETLYRNLYSAARKKLTGTLGDILEDLLKQILPDFDFDCPSQSA